MTSLRRTSSWTLLAAALGAHFGLLRLYRDSRSGDLLERATRHAANTSSPNPGAARMASAVGSGKARASAPSTACRMERQAMPVRSLPWRQATGREDFAAAASECIAFENSSYDAGEQNRMTI